MSFAERYRVTEGRFGETDAESVTSDEEVVAPSLNKNKLPELIGIQTETEESPTESQEPRPETDGDSVNEGVDVHPVNKQTSQKMGVFEQKYLEAEQKERSEIVQKLLRNKGSNPVDATAVNEQDFVDSEALEAGNISSEPERSPYFIQVDAEGRVTTQAYDPNLEKAFAESQRNKKYDFTQATIYSREDRSEQSDILENADPVAKSILFGQSTAPKSYYESFTESCCETLLFDKKNTLEKGLSYFFELNEDDLSYRFKEGDSRYVLLKLPVVPGKNYPLRLRTFIREFKDKGIKNGVFFPQLITLDKDKKPLRIITGPLLKFVPENWMKYGYLQGVFDIDQTVDREEIYLLINTTRKIRREASVIELESSSVTIEHMNRGSLEIEILSGKGS